MKLLGVCYPLSDFSLKTLTLNDSKKIIQEPLVKALSPKPDGYDVEI